MQILIQQIFFTVWDFTVPTELSEIGCSQHKDHALSSKDFEHVSAIQHTSNCMYSSFQFTWKSYNQYYGFYDLYFIGWKKMNLSEVR